MVSALQLWKRRLVVFSWVPSSSPSLIKTDDPTPSDILFSWVCTLKSHRNALPLDQRQTCAGTIQLVLGSWQKNWSDYFSKLHPPTHHKLMRSLNLPLQHARVYRSACQPSNATVLTGDYSAGINTRYSLIYLAKFYFLNCLEGRIIFGKGKCTHCSFMLSKGNREEQLLKIRLPIN